MNRKIKTIALETFVLVVVVSAPWQTRAQDTKAPYPSMAPLDQYLMERNAEIALARSAAPESISRDAEVLVLGRHGYETAVKGKDGFVCVVERSWMAPFDHPEFWNPKMRGPLCFNPPAVRSILPLPFKRSELVLAGLSKAQIIDAIKIFVKKELPPLEPGGMTYMMSSQASLGDDVGHWAPHLIVLSSPDRRYDLGCRRAWLSRFAESTISWRSRADQRVHDSSVQMVGRNGTHRYSLTVRSRLFAREVTIGPANLLSGSSCGLYWRRAFCPSPSKNACS